MTVEDDLLRLETSGPVGRLGGRLDELRAAIALMAVTGDYSGLADLLAAFAVPGGIDAALADAAEEAARLGAADARQGIGAAGRTVARMSPPSGLAMQVIIGLAQARKLAATGPTTLAGSLAAVSPLTKAGLAVQRAQAYQVNLAANHARAAVLDKAGVGIMWVPERNACVHCTAYAGVSRNAKGQFPAGLTYGAKPLPAPPHGMATPPLHPNCRCALQGYDADVAAALKREADRSILRGFALESESERARLDAAERLLASGVRAPASVKRYAETAINRGGFDPAATRA